MNNECKITIEQVESVLEEQYSHLLPYSKSMVEMLNSDYGIGLRTKTYYVKIRDCALSCIHECYKFWFIVNAISSWNEDLNIVVNTIDMVSTEFLSWRDKNNIWPWDIQSANFYEIFENKHLWTIDYNGNILYDENSKVLKKDDIKKLKYYKKRMTWEFCYLAIPYDHLPCYSQFFEINWISADISDFGVSQDEDRDNAEEDKGCWNHQFTSYWFIKDWILEKYKINESQYNEIAWYLSEEFYVWSCWWCV